MSVEVLATVADPMPSNSSVHSNCSGPGASVVGSSVGASVVGSTVGASVGASVVSSVGASVVGPGAGSPLLIYISPLPVVVVISTFVYASSAICVGLSFTKPVPI